MPLVHTAHTLVAVKNASLADGDEPEPPLRAVGEQQVVDEANRLVVNTEDEARQLVSLQMPIPAESMSFIPGSIWKRSPPVTGRQPGRAGRYRWRSARRVRRPHPAVEGPGRAAARSSPAA